MEKNKGVRWFFQVIFNEEKCNKALTLLGENLILKLEHIYKWIYTGYGIYLFITLLQFPVILYISQEGEIYYMPFWWVIPTILLVIHVIMIIILLKTYKTLEALRRKCKDISDIYQKYIKSAKEIKKFKPGFFYAPHKVEKYVEAMELKGFRLRGNSSLVPMITFRRGEPRLAKCCVDIQRKASNEYFQLYKDSGWELRYKDYDGFYEIIIWVKEYEKGQEVPHIYSEDISKYKNSKRLLIWHSVFTVAFLTLLFINVINDITRGNGLYKIFLNCFILICWLYYYSRTVAYFINVRKESKRDVI